MIYLQRNIPSPNKIYNFSLSDFSGGLNNTNDVLKDNESPDLLNMVFSSEDIMSKRHGQKLYNSNSYHNPIVFLDSHYGHSVHNSGLVWGSSVWGEVFRSSSVNTIISTESSLYINRDFISEVYSGVKGVSYLSNYYYVDGDSIYVYGKFPQNSGTYIKINGSPSSDSVLMKIVNPPKDYTPLDKEVIRPKQKIVVIESILLDTEGQGFSNVSFGGKAYVYLPLLNTVSNVIVGKSYSVIYDNIGRVHFEAIVGDGEAEYGSKHLSGVTVYDYLKQEIWYEPCLLEIEDEYKGANVLPVMSKLIVNHKGRIFLSASSEDDNNIFISDVGNPYYFPVGLPIQVPPNGDKINNIIVYDDCVVVGRSGDIYALRGETNRLDVGLELFSINKLNTHTGFINSSSVNVSHNYLFFIGSDGNAYSLSSVSDRQRIMTTNILNKTINLFKEPIEFSISDIEKAVTFFHDDNWYVQIKEKTLVFSYRNMSWTILSGLDARSFLSIDNKLFWGNGDGNLVSFSDNFLDFGKPYEAYWKSKHFDTNDAGMDKYFKNFFITAKLFDNIKNKMYVTFDIDHKQDIYYNVIDVNDTGKTYQSTPYYINRRGKNIQFTLKSGYIYNGAYFDLPGMLYTHTGMVNGEMAGIRLTGDYYLYEESTKFDYVPDYSNPDNTNIMIASVGWTKLDSEDVDVGMRVVNINFNYEERGRYLR